MKQHDFLLDKRYDTITIRQYQINQAFQVEFQTVYVFDVYLILYLIIICVLIVINQRNIDAIRNWTCFGLSLKHILFYCSEKLKSTEYWLSFYTLFLMSYNFGNVNVAFWYAMNTHIFFAVSIFWSNKNGPLIEKKFHCVYLLQYSV